MKVYYIWRDKKEIKMKRSRKRKKNKTLSRSKKGLIILIIITVLLCVVTTLKKQEQSKEYTENKSDYIDSVKPDNADSSGGPEQWHKEGAPYIDVELLTPNEYSRPGIATNKIIGIVVHYTANPGATAMNNRDYFEGLKDSHITKASSNFVVGLEGEIVQCVPTWEIAYASNSRNIDTVSIECCHQSMVDLCAWLCLKFDLDENDVIRHYDVTGKICPKYFVENEDAWRKFKSDIGTKLKKLEEYQ